MNWIDIISKLVPLLLVIGSILFGWSKMSEMATSNHERSTQNANNISKVAIQSEEEKIEIEKMKVEIKYLERDLEEIRMKR